MGIRQFNLGSRIPVSLTSRIFILLGNTMHGLWRDLTLAWCRLALQPFFVRLMPAFDPFVVAIAPISMFPAALVACYVPARRAARLHPNAALRDS